MFDALRKFTHMLFCHRALYGAMALTYGAASFGLDKTLVNQLAFAVYLAITARG